MKKLQTESSRMLAKMPAKKSVQRFTAGGPVMSQEMFQRWMEGSPGRSEEQMRLTLTNMGLNPPPAASAPAPAATTSPGTGAAPVPYNPIVPTPATSAPVPLPVAAPVAPQVIAPPVAPQVIAPPVAPAPVPLPVAAPAAPVNASSNMYAAENARRAAMAAEEAARKRALYAKTPVVSDKAARQKAESDAKNARKQAELKAKSARAPQFSAATNRSTYKAPPPLYSSLPRDPLPPPIRLRDPLPPPIRFTPATNKSTYKAPPPLYSPAPAASRSTAPLPTRAGPQFTPATNKSTYKAPPPLYSPAPAASRSTAPLPTRAGPQFTPATNRNTFVPARPLYSPAPAARATPAAPVFRPASNQPAPQSRFDQMMANLPTPARPVFNAPAFTTDLNNYIQDTLSSAGVGSPGSGSPSSPASGSADSGSFDGVPVGGEAPAVGAPAEEVVGGEAPAGGAPAGEGVGGEAPAVGAPGGGGTGGGIPENNAIGGGGNIGGGVSPAGDGTAAGGGGGTPAGGGGGGGAPSSFVDDWMSRPDPAGGSGSPLPGGSTSAREDLEAVPGFPRQGDPGFPLPGDPGFPTLGGETSARDDLDGFDQVGTAPGQVNGPPMGTAPGQVNGPPMGTAPGQVNGPPMGTAPGQVNGPPMGTAPGQVNGPSMGTAPGQVNANVGSPVVPPVAPPTAAEQAAALRALIKAGPQTQEELDKALLKYSPQQLAAAFPEFGGVPEYTTAAEEARKRAAAAAAAAASPVVAPPPVAPPPVAPPPVAPPPVAPPPVAPPPVAPPVVAPPVVAPPPVAPPPVAPPVVPPTGIPVTMPTGPGEFGPGTMLPRPGTGGTPSGPVVPGYGVPTVPGAGIRPPGLNAFEDEVLKRQAAGISTSAFDVNLPPPPNSYERPMVPNQAGSPSAPASPARSMGNGSLDPHTLGSYKKLSDTFGTTRDRMGNAVASAVLPTTDAVRRGQLSAQSAGGGASMSNTLGTTTDRFGNVIAAPTMPAFFKEGGEAVSSDTYISDYLQQEQEKTDSADIDPLGTAQKYLTDLTGATKKLSPVRQSIKRPSRVAGGAESSKEMNLKLAPIAVSKQMILDTTSSPGEPKNTDSARAQMEAFVEQYKRKIEIAKNKARGLRANTLGAPTLEAPTLTRNTLAKKTFAEGGEVKNFEDEEVSQEELDAASRPAFVTPKSGKGRKEGEISKQLKSGAAYANMAKGVTELPYDLAGAGVDLATMAMRPFGYSTEKPVMGSDFIKEKMTKLGVRPEPPADPTAKGFYTAGELLSNLVNPAGAVRAGVKGAEKVGQAATNVGKDFMEYNRQISVPGASYAVRPTGSTMLTGTVGLNKNVSEVDQLLQGGITEAKYVTERNDEKRGLIENFWNTKARNYFERQFGTPDDPILEGIKTKKLKGTALQDLRSGFPRSLIDSLAVGKTRVKEGERPSADFVGPGAPQSRFFPEYPESYEDVARRYDEATGLRGNLITTNPAAAETAYSSISSEGRAMGRAAADAEADKMMAQGMPPEQINTEIGITTRGVKDPDRIVSENSTRSAKDLYAAFEEASAYKKMTPEQQLEWANDQYGKGRSEFRGMDPSEVGPNLMPQNVFTAIEKGEPVYDIGYMGKTLEVLFKPENINQYLASLPARELANIRFEDAVRGGLKLGENQFRLDTLVRRIKSGKPVADKVFSDGVSSPLLQFGEGSGLDGFAWKRIEKREATVPEGAYVGHSVGGYELGGVGYSSDKRNGFNTGVWQVYTLRDNRNRPVNTIEVKMLDENTPVVTQIKGNGRASGNTAPEKYDGGVLRFLQEYLKPVAIEESDSYLTPLLQNYKTELGASPRVR